MLHRADQYNSLMTTLELYEKARELQEAGKRFALATVIYTTGSTPQKAGASALFEAAGPVWGTLAVWRLNRVVARCCLWTVVSLCSLILNWMK
jgi:hypothetical protein